MQMRRVMQAWNVSVLAQLGGVAVLKSPDVYLEETKIFLKQERRYLEQELKALGFLVYPSKANYLFLEGKEGLYEKALENGFLIRDCQNYMGLEKGAYRIAIRTHEENERIVTWLKQL